MIIAVDIDEVVANTLPAFLLHYNNKYKTFLTSENFPTSDWGAKLDLITSKLNNEIGEFIRGQYYRHLIPVDGAADALETLKSKYSLQAVTSRWGELATTTGAWIEEFIPNKFEKIHFSKTSHAHSDIYSSKKKSEICKEIKAELIIEDCPLHALDCADNGIRVILFDRPWNQTLNRQGITRAKSWKEVVDQINFCNLKLAI